MTQHRTLALKAYNKNSIAHGPRNEAWQVKLTDHATSVMTDFLERAMFKVDANEKVDEALMQMKHAGLRAAFVMDREADRVLGLLTAYDVMGEKPLRFLQSDQLAGRELTRRDIRVRDIMEKVEDWTVVDMHDVELSTVQSVLEAFQKSGRTHLPVMESAEGGKPRLRGLFSSSKILRLTQDARKRPAAPATAKS